jgi:hypothetical protein
VESRNEKKNAPKTLREGDLVLIWDAIKGMDKSSGRKLDDRWLGPYRIQQAWPNRGYYRLEDLNGVTFSSTTRVDRLKKFEELPNSVEGDILRGRLKIYPEVERIAAVRPEHRKAIGGRRQEVERSQ